MDDDNDDNDQSQKPVGEGGGVRVKSLGVTNGVIVVGRKDRTAVDR
jgi:hypothetical protein